MPINMYVPSAPASVVPGAPLNSAPIHRQQQQQLQQAPPASGFVLPPARYDDDDPLPEIAPAPAQPNAPKCMLLHKSFFP